MLLLSRRNQQGIRIEPASAVPKDMKVKDLFGEQGIRIKVVGIENGVVKIGIEAPNEFKILRDELEKWEDGGEGDANIHVKTKKTSSANLYRRRKATITPTEYS